MGTRRHESPGVSQPTVANGTVYVRDGYNTFWAIDAATGEYRWERQYDTHPGGDTWDQMAISGFYSTIVAADSKLFALAQLNNGEYHLFTFDTETGDVLNVLPARPNSTYISNPIVADGRLYLTGGGASTSLAHRPNHSHGGSIRKRLTPRHSQTARN
ncbi:PQQ-binding-like beta-propeller repeat protein [Haladaptatus sp. GCM10025707]|uniref:outer membrane protein assembly factor BamB family protein n=1 Tax=Haladaptatus sp. GCM10025707 TaxID=3252658 RepID=UPI0036068530